MVSATNTKIIRNTEGAATNLAAPEADADTNLAAPKPGAKDPLAGEKSTAKTVNCSSRAEDRCAIIRGGFVMWNEAWIHLDLYDLCERLTALILETSGIDLDEFERLKRTEDSLPLDQWKELVWQELAFSEFDKLNEYMTERLNRKVRELIGLSAEMKSWVLLSYPFDVKEITVIMDFEGMPFLFRVEEIRLILRGMEKNSEELPFSKKAEMKCSGVNARGSVQVSTKVNSGYPEKRRT